MVDGSRLRHPAGAEMEAIHFGPEDAPIFAVVHRPAVPPKGIVVVCSPPYTEAARNQRREILFGWLCAENGWAVVRFHPRGAGHSSGETSDLSLDTMLDDTDIVSREAIRRLETPLIGFVGTRLGAVVAHRAAALHPGAPVAWWHPVLDPDLYLREIFRAGMIGALKSGVTTNRPEMESRLKKEGILDIMGSPIGRSFYESLFAAPLDNAPTGPRQGLLVQMSTHSELLGRFESFVSKLRGAAWAVTTSLVTDEETWWFGARGRQRGIGDANCRSRSSFDHC